MPDFIRVIQITDTHLFADPDKCLLGLNTQNSCAAVLKAAQTRPADLFLLTGDLAQDESVPAYQRLAEQISALKKPAYWIPGNRDDYQNMLIGLQDLRAEKQIVRDGWQIILLNSQVPKKVPGFLAPAELEFLEKCLQEYPQHYAMICFHHPPLTVGSHWLDPLILKNPWDLFAIIDKYPQVKIILNGHIHQDFHGHYKKIPIYATPSTCIQFKPQAYNFTLDIIPPGFRYLELHPNGQVKTEIIRALQFTEHLQANSNAKGY